MLGKFSAKGYKFGVGMGWEGNSWIPEYSESGLGTYIRPRLDVQVLPPHPAPFLPTHVRKPMNRRRAPTSVLSTHHWKLDVPTSTKASLPCGLKRQLPKGRLTSGSGDREKREQAPPCKQLPLSLWEQCVPFRIRVRPSPPTVVSNISQEHTLGCVAPLPFTSVRNPVWPCWNSFTRLLSASNGSMTERLQGAEIPWHEVAEPRCCARQSWKLYLHAWEHGSKQSNPGAFSGPDLVLGDGHREMNERSIV